MRTRTLTLLGLGICSCSGDPGTGRATLSVTLEGESTIRQPIEPGPDGEQMSDGWTASYQRYVAVLGHVQLGFASDDSLTVEDERWFAVDLRQVPSGVALWSFDGLREGRWNFGYGLGSGHDAEPHESVSAGDFARIQEEGLSYLIAGKLEQTGGASCPPALLAQPGDAVPSDPVGATDPCYPNPLIEFDWGVVAETEYAHCEIDGIPGVALSDDHEQSATITLHGDHLFFNGFPEGGEGAVVRSAQWLADCDLNLDGQVTRAELEAIRPEDLPALASAELGGSPLTPLDSMWTYVTAQLKTQGHYEGEGECAIDGAAHDH